MTQVEGNLDLNGGSIGLNISVGGSLGMSLFFNLLCVITF